MSPVGTDGRALGARAQATRRRVLDATSALLAERGTLGIKVVDVARTVDISPATFYQYFADVEAAILALVDESSAAMEPIIAAAAMPWGDDVVAGATALAEAFDSHRDRFRAVLRTRDLRAEEGDQRFRDARIHAYSGLMAALVAKVERAQTSQRMSDQLNPFATAAAIVAILERLTMYRVEMERRGVDRDSMITTIARLIAQTVDVTT